jgi:glycosyltransferase involved in cell wall biosynthesis
MRLLIITQAVDERDPVLGFFTYWIKEFSKYAQIDVICLKKGSFQFGGNVQIFSLGKERGVSRLGRAVRFVFLTMRLLPQSDVVFVHMAPEYVRAIYPFNIFFRKPIFMWYAHIAVSAVARFALQHVNRVFTPSCESFQEKSEKVIETGHGINTEIFKPGDPFKEHTVVTVSRISKVKKIETLIKAAKILKDKNISFSVEIFGAPARPEDSRYLKELQDLSIALGVEQEIVWRGEVQNNEVQAHYCSAHVFVRLQGGGGFGKTELEAMSCGIPAVVPTEVYRNKLGEFGKELFFAEDDPLECAEAISKVFSWSSEQRKRYGQISRDFVVQNHNVSNLVRKIINEIYNVQ